LLSCKIQHLFTAFINSTRKILIGETIFVVFDYLGSFIGQWKFSGLDTPTKSLMLEIKSKKLISITR